MIRLSIIIITLNFTEKCSVALVKLTVYNRYMLDGIIQVWRVIVFIVSSIRSIGHWRCEKAAGDLPWMEGNTAPCNYIQHYIWDKHTIAQTLRQTYKQHFLNSSLSLLTKIKIIDPHLRIQKKKDQKPSGFVVLCNVQYK